ncbi:glutathione S-transferase [Flagellatimonas centrodinii]|uniref:glutathione S-transferase family protein n=1 Tax=Flagellatimonas centrodinii TaxID=2806210 RepID=UPI001FEFA27B|nr:glutathione S-transferase [Flagellatimonas centrodinii]ULQ46229.1 glutathione S-transferase [Flagellatimonas centrodinii]
MRLITIPMSHYCEKARWGLVYAGVAYVEEGHLQGLHIRVARRHNPAGLLPVLIDGDKVVADSTAILRYLDGPLPAAQRLYPPMIADEVAALEEDFDEHLGVETRRWVYFHWLPQSGRDVVRVAAQGTPRWQRWIGPPMYPLLRVALKRHLAVTADKVRHGLGTIEQTFDRVAARLADGRPYLCGDRFTAADLSFACMASPVLLPPEYGIRLPALDEAPTSARADLARFRAHPAGRYALDLFARHRRVAARDSPHDPAYAVTPAPLGAP